MKDEIKAKLGTDELIALCHILYNFDEFDLNLSNFFKSNNKSAIYDLYKISKGQFVMGAKGVKSFYKENKFVIDTINTYSNIINFIGDNYDLDGQLKEESGLSFFYKYILNYKDEMQSILSIFEKIKELGFGDIEFNDGLDFSKVEYKIDVNFSENFIITYLDNMYFAGSFDKGIIDYRTIGSNYRIIVRPDEKGTSLCNKKITVNSLLFEADRLPDVISKESIFDKIVSLADNRNYDDKKVIDFNDFSGEFESGRGRSRR